MSTTFNPGDTLSKIADQQLGDFTQWRELADFNNLDIFEQINPGVNLQIPDADQLRSLLETQGQQLLNQLPDLSSVGASRFGNTLQEIKLIDWLY